MTIRIIVDPFRWLKKAVVERAAVVDGGGGGSRVHWWQPLPVAAMLVVMIV